MDRGKNIAQGTWVTVIDPREAAPRRLRVAAYARVSTDSEDQVNSYIAQVDFYTRYIREHTGWELVDVYADEGISGMETQHREEFNKMIADCWDGKIDRILVKSISRFARNQTDFILHMRELLQLGVSIHFEKENLDTGNMSSEMVADIYGAFAQMESSSHSKNMRVSNRIRMEKGLFVPASAPYGYRLENRELQIVPEEAEIVRYIFRGYLAGRGKEDLAKELNERSVGGDKEKGAWFHQTIGYILSNPTYTGDQLWHKTYMTETLPYVKKWNTGQYPKYYAEDCCPAIISKEEFRQVQELIKKRKESWKQRSTEKPPFQGHIYCGVCGARCRRKQINGKSYWICRSRDRDKALCPVPQIAEDGIQTAVNGFLTKMVRNKDQILSPMLTQLRELQELELRSNGKLIEIDEAIAKLTEQSHVLTRLKSKGYLDSALYLSERNELDAKVRELRSNRRKLLNESPEEETIRQTEDMLEFLESRTEQAVASDGEILAHLVDRVYLEEGKQIRIALHSGLEVMEYLPGGKA